MKDAYSITWQGHADLLAPAHLSGACPWGSALFDCHLCQRRQHSQPRMEGFCRHAYGRITALLDSIENSPAYLFNYPEFGCMLLVGCLVLMLTVESSMHCLSAGTDKIFYPHCKGGFAAGAGTTAVRRLR